MIQMNEVIRDLKAGISERDVLDEERTYVSCECEYNDENSFVIKYHNYETKEEDKYRIIVEKL